MSTAAPDPNREPAGIPMITVYGPGTSDFPGEYVARAFLAVPGEIYVRPDLFTRGRSLDDVRRQIKTARPDMVRLGRAEADDPNIIEVWL